MKSATRTIAFNDPDVCVSLVLLMVVLRDLKPKKRDAAMLRLWSEINDTKALNVPTVDRAKDCLKWAIPRAFAVQGWEPPVGLPQVTPDQIRA